ncbi:MAG: ABC transporter ATP-binding protein [Spirochaetales bacterium]|nr:ABC transporter ATP-binding protein [Spirochaetales bacterium]
MIRIEDMKKYYGKNRGVENLSLEIKQGEIFGFIGPNGAGKSTTIRALLGFIKLTSGKAFLFDKEATDKNLAKTKERIGYLPSEVDYYENLKVGELLKYSASFYKRDCQSRIDELAKYFDLNLKRNIKELSYGNKKKVAIIQAFMHSPELLILDEPTGGLDPLMQNKFFELVVEEKKRGATVFFSSHILSEVQRLCDRVGIIKNGELIKLTTIDELVKTQYKKVTVRLEDGQKWEIADTRLSNLNINDSYVSFVYKGEMEFLLKILGKYEISDFNVSEPDLEEIFMDYYKEEK